MHEYDFISRRITEDQVRKIISEAEYDPSDYTYSRRVGGDGYLVKGDVVMSTTVLRNAAKALHIDVEIT